MNEAVMETQCTKCIHKEVCKHKQDFLDICEAAYNLEIHRSCSEDRKISIIPAKNFECLNSIIVSCRYFGCGVQLTR